MITIPVVVRNWKIKNPEVYRYLNQEYINEFFSTGRIRLSTFVQFKKNPDEQMGDSTEGKNVLYGTDGKNSFVALTQHGVNSFVLCTSTEESSELMTSFKVDGYFKIKDTIGFAAAIANRIPGFLEGLEGFCKYSLQRNIQRKLPDSIISDLLSNPEKQIPLDKIFSLTEQVGQEDVFFIKHTSFRNQSEYRFIWNVSVNTNDALFINCPEAIQHCEKIT